MRSLAFSFALLTSLSLQAQPQKLAEPQPQTLENLRQYASGHFENLSCTQVQAPSNSKTITIEMVDPSAPHHGTPTGINTVSLFQDVFAPSAGTDFEWDHWGMLKGKKLAVYRYSNQFNGKTHAGLVYADENSGAISRIIFRGTDSTAHLFCTAPSR